MRSALSPLEVPFVLMGVTSGCGEAVVSRSMSMELRMLSSLAAAIADRCRRSSSGGRLSGWDSSLRELRFDEKKVGFDEVVEDERLCVGRNLVDFVGDDFRGEENADFCGDVEKRGVGGEEEESGARIAKPSTSSLVWERTLAERSLRGERLSFLRSFLLSFSLSLSLSLSLSDLEKS